MKIKMLFILTALVLLSGCQSWYYAGMTKVKFEPMELKGETVCCKGTYISGKEFQKLDVAVKKDLTGWSIRIKADDVKNVESIKAAGESMKGVIESLKPGS